MDKYYQKTINLSKHVTGQEIIDAMQTMADGRGLSGNSLEYISEETGNANLLKVGFASLYPYKQVVVLTGENLDKARLNPESTYGSIALKNMEWWDWGYAVAYSQETLEENINKIADTLESRLK
jgi:hypothetical protein